MNINNPPLKLSNDHTFSPTHLSFNEPTDKFITCNQDSQLHIYSIPHPHNQHTKITKLGFANIFNQNVIDVSWGNAHAGGYIAISGSQGSLVILRIQQYGSEAIIEKHFQFKYNIVSLDWHYRKKMLLCGTNDGKVLIIVCKDRQWQIEQQIQFPSPSNISVAWSLFDNDCKYISCEQKLYQLLTPPLKNIYKKQQNRIKQIYKFNNNQLIKNILIRNQGLPNLIELILLTTKKISILQYNSLTSKLQPLQNIQQIKNIQTIKWNHHQNQFACYPSIKLFDNSPNTNHQIHTDNPPLVFKRKVNGIWSQIK